MISASGLKNKIPWRKSREGILIFLLRRCSQWPNVTSGYKHGPNKVIQRMTCRTRCSTTEIEVHLPLRILDHVPTRDPQPPRVDRSEHRLKTPSGNRPIRSYFSDRNGSRGYATASPSHGDLLRALNYNRPSDDLRDIFWTRHTKTSD